MARTTRAVGRQTQDGTPNTPPTNTATGPAPATHGGVSVDAFETIQILLFMTVALGTIPYLAIFSMIIVWPMWTGFELFFFLYGRAVGFKTRDQENFVDVLMAIWEHFLPWLSFHYYVLGMCLGLTICLSHGFNAFVICWLVINITWLLWGEFRRSRVHHIAGMVLLMLVLICSNADFVNEHRTLTNANSTTTTEWIVDGVLGWMLDGWPGVRGFMKIKVRNLGFFSILEVGGMPFVLINILGVTFKCMPIPRFWT